MTTTAAAVVTATAAGGRETAAFVVSPSLAVRLAQVASRIASASRRTSGSGGGAGGGVGGEAARGEAAAAAAEREQEDEGNVEQQRQRQQRQQQQQRQPPRPPPPPPPRPAARAAAATTTLNSLRDALRSSPPGSREREAAFAKLSETKESTKERVLALAAASGVSDLDVTLYVRWRSQSGRVKTTALELKGPLGSLDELRGMNKALVGRAFPPPRPHATTTATATARGRNTTATATAATDNEVDASAAAVSAAAAANAAMRSDAEERQREREEQLRQRMRQVGSGGPSSLLDPFGGAAAPAAPPRPLFPPEAVAAAAQASPSRGSARPRHLTSPSFYRFTPSTDFSTLPADDVSRTEFVLAVTPRSGKSAGWEFPLVQRELGRMTMRREERPSSSASLQQQQQQENRLSSPSSRSASSSPNNDEEQEDSPLLVTVVEFESTAMSLGLFGLRVSLIAYPVISVSKKFLDDAATKIRNGTFVGAL